MIAEAAAGQFEMEGFEPVPRIQIVTVEEALALRDDAFKKAAREEDRGAQGARMTGRRGTIDGAGWGRRDGAFLERKRVKIS